MESIKKFIKEYKSIAKRKPKSIDEGDKMMSDLFNLLANKCISLEERLEELEKNK